MSKTIASVIISAFLLCFLRPCGAEIDQTLPLMGSSPDINRQGAKQILPEDIKAALQQMKDLVETARKQAALEKEIAALSSLCRMQAKLGLLQEAEKHYLELLELYEQQGDVRAQAETLNGLGKIYIKMGPVEKSLDFFERTLNVYDRIGDTGNKIATLNSMAAVHSLLGEYQRALDNYKRGLELALRVGDQTNRGRLLGKIGGVELTLDRGPAALKHFEEALKVQSDNADTTGKAVTFNNLAQLRRAWAQYAAAIDLCDKAVKEVRQNGDGPSSAELLLTKALILQDLGNYDEAVASSEDALEISQKSFDDQGIVESLRVIAQLELLRGDSRRALELCEKALEFSVALADKNEEALALLSKATILSENGQYQEVGPCLCEALTLKKTLGIPWDAVIQAAAELSIRSGEGLAHSKQLLEGYPLRDRRRQSLLLGRVALKMGEFKEARDYFRPVTEDKSPMIRFAAATGLGLADEGWGLLSEAKEAYEKAISQAEEIRDSLNTSQRKNFFQAEDQGLARTAPYEGLSRVLLKLGQPHESFRMAEMTKGRAFSDALVGASNIGLSNVPDNVRQGDEEMSEKFHHINLLYGIHASPFGVSEWAGGLLANFRTKREEHIQKLREMYPIYAATRYPEPMDLSQSALHEHEWVLEYQVTETGVIIFLIQGKTIRCSIFRSIPRNDLNKLIYQFKSSVEVTEEAELLPKLWAFDFVAGKKLADILLGETISLVPAGDPIIVVPDGCLGLISFEMLVLDGSGGMSLDPSGTPCTMNAAFLGDRNPISYYQSITALTLTRLRPREQNPKNRQIILTDPVFSIEDPRVADARADAPQEYVSHMNPWVYTLLMSIRHRLTFPRLERTRDLGRALKVQNPHGTDLYEGMDASKTVLLHKDLTDYEAVVIASHGYVGGDLPGLREPVLVLTLVDQPDGQDGFLRMSEVMGLRLNANMVALTACRTGVGNLVRGEGTMFLGRAFQTGGARTVLVSLWNVGEESSVALTQNFFNHLRTGKSKLEALRQARIEIRKKFNHPFFWSSFILVGETE